MFTKKLTQYVSMMSGHSVAESFTVEDASGSGIQAVLCSSDDSKMRWHGFVPVEEKFPGIVGLYYSTSDSEKVEMLPMELGFYWVREKTMDLEEFLSLLAKTSRAWRLGKWGSLDNSDGDGIIAAVAKLVGSPCGFMYDDIEGACLGIDLGVASRLYAVDSVDSYLDEELFELIVVACGFGELDAARLRFKESMKAWFDARGDKKRQAAWRLEKSIEGYMRITGKVVLHTPSFTVSLRKNGGLECIGPASSEWLLENADWLLADGLEHALAYEGPDTLEVSPGNLIVARNFGGPMEVWANTWIGRYLGIVGVDIPPDIQLPASAWRVEDKEIYRLCEADLPLYGGWSQEVYEDVLCPILALVV